MALVHKSPELNSKSSEEISTVFFIGYKIYTCRKLCYSGVTTITMKILYIQGDSKKKDISSLMIAVFDLDSWNLVPGTGLTQGIRIWNKKLRFLKMTVQIGKFKFLKSEKNGASEKKRWYQQFLR